MIGENHRREIARWERLWGLPRLAEETRISFSARLRTSLGRCTPSKKSIRLHPGLQEAPEELLLEVLCHELAHVAVFELHGRRPKPHGPEWKELVRRAGYEPRVKLAVAGEAEARIPRSLRPASRPLYEHRCPICHGSRLARRPMRRWRCRACVEAGLGGLLEIRSMPGKLT